MERALGILGSAVLLSLLSVMFLLVDNANTTPQPTRDEPRDISEVPYEQLSDAQKLERLSLPDNVSDDTLLNRALAYGNTSYCQPIQDDSTRQKCFSDTRGVQGDRIDNTSDEAVTSTDRQLFNRAVAYQDEELCRQIVLRTLRDRCLQRVST